jgi:hypothetical protein
MNRRVLVCAVLIVSMLTAAQAVVAQGKVVFSQGANGNELWVANDNPANPNPKKLATVSSYLISPRWSPNGQWIAFQSGTALWMVTASGDLLQAVGGVAPIADAGLAWRPDGSGIIYAAVRVCHEYLRTVDLTFNADGTVTASNDRAFYDPGAGVGPALFPDVWPSDPVNPRVAYMRYRCGAEFTSDFHGIEIAGENGINFLAIPPSPDVFRQQLPRWSADGQTLLTMVRFLSTNETALETLNPYDNGVPRQQYVRTRGFFQGLDFGCTTDTILFSWNDGGSLPLNVFRFDVPTGRPRRLTSFTSGVVREVDHFCAEPLGS